MSMLKRYRVNADLTQKEMAEKLGVSYPAYRNYELGKQKMSNKVLIKFLKLRALPQDLELVKILEELL